MEGFEPAIPVTLAPEAFGGPSPGLLVPDMVAGSVQFRSNPRISSLSCMYTNVILTGCIFVYKNFFYLESAGLWWEFVFFIFYFGLF